MALTLREAQDAWYFTFQYDAGWYSYETPDNMEHLIIDWIEVAEWYEVFQHTNDVWEVKESSERDNIILFYKWEKVCSAYRFHRTKHNTVYQALLSWKDREWRFIDVLDRTTWF